MLHRIARRAAAITTIALLGACDTKSPAAPASQADSTTMEAAPSILRRSGLGVDLSTVVLPTGTVRALEASFSTRQRTTSWTSSDPSLVRVDAAGRVTALGNGLATITARSLRNSQTWRVLGVDLATMRVEMEPRTIALQVGQNLSVDVSAETSTGLSLPTHTAEFSAENPSVALVLSSGRVFGVRPGTTRINMNLFGVTRSIPVTVGGGAADPTTPVLTSFAIAPRGAITLAAGESEQFTATGAWSDNATRPVNVTYSASGGTITAEGLYTAPAAAGTYRVIGAPAGSSLRDTAVVTVPAAPAVLTSLRLAPRTVTMAPRATQVFTTTALWSTGATTVPAVTFTTTGGSMNTTTRTYTAPSTPGTYRVIVAHSGGPERDTATVTVAAAAPTVTAFTISPASVTLAAGATRQFATSATWSDGATRAVTVAYTATGGTISSAGLYTAGTTGGSYRVIATCSCGLADTSAVTVTAPVAPTATAFVLSPGSATIAAGATRQFSTATTWSDGATRSVTVSYQATGGTISVGGLYTAGQIAGTFAVIATCSCGRADTSAVTVTAPVAPTATAFVLSPGSASLTAGGTRQFSTATTWSDGATRAVTVSYQATGGTISVGGLYTAGQVAGTFAVIATCSCGRADTSAVSVAAPQLLSLTISPKTVTLNVNETRAFSASALWNTGATTLPNVAYSVIGSGGTIDPTTGAYRAPASAGTYRVVVAQVGGAARDTAVVTVQGTTTTTPPPPSTGAWNLASNLPTGVSLRTDTDHSTLVPSGWPGFATRMGQAPTILSDGSAPTGGSQFMRQNWAGVYDGESPHYLWWPTQSTHMYFATVVRISSAMMPTNEVKWITFNPGNGFAWIGFYGAPDAAGYEMRFVRRGSADYHAGRAGPLVRIPLDQWAKVQMEVRINPVRVRIWINDVLAVSETGTIRSGERAFSWNGMTNFGELQLGSTWGGGNGRSAPSGAFVDYARTAIWTN